MEREELIYSGRWSRGYRKGNTFIKELMYYEPASLQREATASNSAYQAGLETPRCLGTINNGSSLRLFFEWKTMDTVLPQHMPQVQGSIRSVIELLQGIPWSPNDYYWEDSLLKDFANALSFIGDKAKEHFSTLAILEPSVFIHGDFSLQNMGLVGSQLFIYDFQHGCLGPKNWDLYYLASTLSPKIISGLHLSDQEKQVVSAIAGVKLGRAIRKRCRDIKLKHSLYTEWIDSKDL